MARSNKKTRNGRYNKLVRDRVPEIIRQRGGNSVTHRAKKVEYWKKLKEKLVEEAKEFIRAEDIEEMADIYEVLDAIVQFKKFKRAMIKKLQAQKASRRGKFTQPLFLITRKLAGRCTHAIQ